MVSAADEVSVVALDRWASLINTAKVFWYPTRMKWEGGEKKNHKLMLNDSMKNVFSRRKI